ncbi:hypothetical protein [Mesorhizobium sangaii]|uniref:Uncharacterized protein n=1 Tax=Mesorhizobium sangaii TaxID=505389 RepID=A0A841PF29_9HYPH|nr:hypothetical protein [Mesorhizobium sangaii]MBB6411278.1 hypothetical protein [Mesorhizobium sangaii]
MIDKHDLPLPPGFAKGIEETSNDLTRRKRRELVVLCCVVIAVGLLCSWRAGNFGPFARSGAALTALSILHAWRASAWAKMMRGGVSEAVVDIFTTVERQRVSGPEADDEARATALKRVSRVVPVMIEAGQYRFLREHLLVSAIGTLIWGFGDLL